MTKERFKTICLVIMGLAMFLMIILYDDGRMAAVEEFEIKLADISRRVTSLYYTIESLTTQTEILRAQLSQLKPEGE